MTPKPGRKKEVTAAKIVDSPAQQVDSSVPPSLWIDSGTGHHPPAPSHPPPTSHPYPPTSTFPRSQGLKPSSRRLRRRRATTLTLTASECSADPKVRPRKPWDGWRKHDFSGPDLVSTVKQDHATSAFYSCPTVQVDIDLGEAGAAGQEIT